MSEHDPHPMLSYAQDEAPRRTAGTWVKLLLVWTIGLMVWALYISGIVFVFFRIFAAPQE